MDLLNCYSRISSHNSHKLRHADASFQNVSVSLSHSSPIQLTSPHNGDTQGITKYLLNFLFPAPLPPAMRLPFFTAVLGFLTTSVAHNIQMGAHQRECFHEVLKRDDKMTVTFQVGDREFGGAGNLEIDFWVGGVLSRALGKGNTHYSGQGPFKALSPLSHHTTTYLSAVICYALSKKHLLTWHCALSRLSAQQASTSSTRKPSPLAIILSMREMTASTCTALAMKLGLRVRRRSASMCMESCMCRRARRRVIRWRLKVCSTSLRLRPWIASYGNSMANARVQDGWT